MNGSKTPRWISIGLAAAMAAASSCHADQDSVPPHRKRNLSRVREAYQENLRKHKGNSDMLVRPGLLANRKQKWVRVAAEATGLPPGEPDEFFLISEESGHDYEATAVALARPSHIHEALVFLGMPVGQPVDYSVCRMWPKGERVIVTFEWETATGERRKAKAEELIVDKRAGNKPLPATGFIFAGSIWTNMPNAPASRVYAADVFNPNSIASDYNDSWTVLDVPRKAMKSAVYSLQTPNPAFPFTKGQWLDVVMEPEHKNGKRRVLDVVLKADAKPATAGATLAQLRLSLHDARGSNVVAEGSAEDLLAFFQQTVESKRDPYVSILPAPAIKLPALASLCALLASIEGENGIRLDAPPPDHLFYMAFVPNEKFRERATRPTQPWELHLSLSGNTATGRLTDIEEVWEDGKTDPIHKITEHPAPTPDAVRKILTEKPGLSVILVFAPAEMEYGTLMSFVRPVMNTHSTIYVFLPLPPQAPTSPKPP